MKPTFTHLLAVLTISGIASGAQAQGRISSNEFNPAISLTLDGRYVDADENELELPGFQLGGEAGLDSQGFSTGHNELTISANIDDKFYGLTTAAIVYEEGETEIELEEAYIQTLGLGSGFTIKGGRFFWGFGYIKSIQYNAHDFSERPIIYEAVFCGPFVDTRLQLTWL